MSYTQTGNPLSSRNSRQVIGAVGSQRRIRSIFAIDLDFTASAKRTYSVRSIQHHPPAERGRERRDQHAVITGG